MVAASSVMKYFFAFLFFTNALAAVPDLPATSDYVFDGDTFAALVYLENGARISVRVRIMNIDAPELKGKCESEISSAEKSKARLNELLPKGTRVVLSKIKDDKYLGRIDALVRFPDGRDIGRIMMDEKLAVAYNGGRRRSWCPAEENKEMKNDD